MPSMPPAEMPPAPPIDNDQDMGNDMPSMEQDGQQNGNNEIQSDAASLGQKLGNAQSSEIKTALNQIIGTCAGNLNPKDVEDIKKKLDSKGSNEDDEEGVGNQEMPMESKKHMKNMLDEIISSITDKEKKYKTLNKKKNIEKNPFTGGRN